MHYRSYIFLIFVQICEVHEKSSQYKGVSWNKKNGKWHAFLCSKGRKTHGGIFSDELDAAKRVNQLCEGLGIPERNPGIGTMPHRLWQVT